MASISEIPEKSLLLPAEQGREFFMEFTLSLKNIWDAGSILHQ
jgi:hypothetical protein